eukprot:10416602-Ditylum_brightwellii.AAC.1
MARRHKPRRGSDQVWVYPKSADVLEEVGLEPMEEYIRRRRQSIAAWVADRPILAACREGERRRGSPQRHSWWWEQEVNLDEALGACPSSTEGSISSVDP